METLLIVPYGSRSIRVPLRVILDPDAYYVWLDPSMTNVAAACELLRPCDARLMRCYPISKRINHVANDEEECSAQVELTQIQNRLFL
jgi:putative SOS response-associated peptidase YedK